VIGRIYRGERVAGLVRYLYGPGRHNEHVDPHLVAAWDATTPDELAAMEPPGGGGPRGTGPRDFRGMIDSLELALALRAKGEQRPVWHCPLRVADADRRLTDAEWGDIARDVMDRTGIAAAGDDGGARWIAVRHDEVSIHLVAVLARQDGRRCHPEFDWPKVREACLAAEARYGLTSTAPADGTAAPATTRAESEKAQRTGRAQDVRSQLRREVRAEAVSARGQEEFLAGLRSRGLLVRERYSTQPGQEHVLTGYAVAAPGDRDKDGQSVYFGGGKLAADLSLPRLRHRWDAGVSGEGAAEPAVDDPHASGPPEHGQRAGAARQAAAAARAVAAGIDEGLRSGSSGDVGRGVAMAAGDALVAAAAALEGAGGGPLTDAAAGYDRAARPPRTQRADPLAAARWEQADAARRLARASHAVARVGRLAAKDDRAAGLELVAALVLLTAAIMELHAASGRLQQAHAAAQTCAQLRAWSEQRAPVAVAQGPTQVVRQPSAAVVQARAEHTGQDRWRRR
jgi:hypothetical protein